MRSTKKNNKKIYAVIVFALLIAFLISAGTVAWLTRTSSVSNTFTVGSFDSPTTSPTDPSVTISLDGNIYEPSWDASAEHKLVPSVEFDKDPYIGIGKGSEAAVVYAYVENNFSNKVYFNINDGWEPVTGYVTVGFASGTYTSGLFKYTAGLDGDTDADVDTGADADTWTATPLFSSVITDENANTEDFTVAEGANSEIVVSSFLHQAKDSEGVDIPADTIEAAVKSAFNLQ